MTESRHALQSLSSDSELERWTEVFTFAAERSASPHQPVEDWKPTSELVGYFRGLPLNPALELPERWIRKQVRVRGAKDTRMKAILRELSANAGPVTIVNHCCVFTRHARELARELNDASVVAADIDPTWQWLYALYERILLRKPPTNFRFVKESVYESALDCSPHAVCVFGACGSLLDASIDLAIRQRASHIVVRACCHENIGINTLLSTRAWSLWNLGHRLKNIAYRIYYRKLGYYWSERYGVEAYPRSQTARSILSSETMLRHAQHSVDCWLCRTLIDLDRILFLVENGYELSGYSESMFVAKRRSSERARPLALASSE
jgi:hypothetical protein